MNQKIVYKFTAPAAPIAPYSRWTINIVLITKFANTPTIFAFTTISSFYIAFKQLSKAFDMPQKSTEGKHK